MRVFARLLSVFTLLLFPIGGCTEVTAKTTAPMTLFVYERPAPGEGQVPLEGVRLCETDTTNNCPSSDARGRVTIELPHNQEYSYTLEKDGYASYHIADMVTDAPAGYSYQRPLESDPLMARRHDSVGAYYPMRGTGTIIISVSPGFAGAMFELVGATSEPFYVDEDEERTWRPDLTETTSAATGGFTEVSAGEFKVRLSGSAQDRCVTSIDTERDGFHFFGLGWPSDEPNTIRVPVREGYINVVSVECPLPL